MPATPRVSVVVPFLDPGAFLRDAIESVLAQTCDSWELILVDDGSRDESSRMAQEYAAAHPQRIFAIAHEGRAHRGMAASRNLGIAKARGEFVASLDADDQFDSTKLSRQVEILDGRPDCAFTFAPMNLWSSWEGGTDEVQRMTLGTSAALPPIAFVPHLLTGRNDPQGTLARTAAVRAVGGYEEGVAMCEDWVLYVKLALRWGVFVDGTPNYRYRLHPGQTCERHRRAGTFHAAFSDFFSWLDAYLRAEGCRDAEVWRSVRQAKMRNRLHRLSELTFSRVAGSFR